LACDSDFHINHRVLLHAANLRHGTEGFISHAKEGMLWIFSPEKSDGFGQVRTRDLGYQMPALDHRSRSPEREELFYADGQTGGTDKMKLIVAVCSYAKERKKQMGEQSVRTDDTRTV
jgi:hypothetical protein